MTHRRQDKINGIVGARNSRAIRSEGRQGALEWTCMIEKEARMALMMMSITIAVWCVAWACFFNGSLAAGIGAIIGTGLIALGGIPWTAESG